MAFSYLQKKHEIKRNILQTRCQDPVTSLLENVRLLLSHDELLLLKTKLRNSKRKRKVYCDDLKHLAVSLSYRSNAAYRYLSKHLNLPPKCTVSKWTSNIRFSEGFDVKVIAALGKCAATMEPRDRLVSLLLDEMSLCECCQYDACEDCILGVTRRAPMNTTTLQQP